MWKYTKKKKIEDPFRWNQRKTYPKALSRHIKIIDSNAILLSPTKFIDKRNPEKIWKTKIIPKKEPKFQK